MGGFNPLTLTSVVITRPNFAPATKKLYRDRTISIPEILKTLNISKATCIGGSTSAAGIGQSRSHGLHVDNQQHFHYMTWGFDHRLGHFLPSRIMV